MVMAFFAVAATPESSPLHMDVHTSAAGLGFS